MSRLYYGIDSPPSNWPHYVTQCNALELHLDALRHAPTLKDLNTWRVHSPKGFAFVLHLSNAFVATWLNASAQEGMTAKALEQALEAEETKAHALAAKAYLLRTPYDFTPGEANRQKLAELATVLGEKKRALIWESQGLWEPSEAMAWGRANKVVVATDPFLAAQEGYLPPAGDDACFVLTERGGMRRKFDQYDMEDVAEVAQAYRRVFILLRGRFKHDHARELKHAVGQQ